MRTRRIRVVVAGATATAVAAIAMVAGGTSASLAVAKGSPVTIGVIGPSTGTIVPFPGGPAAAQAWARGLNKKGGLNGHHINLVVCDSKNDPNQSLTCARNMVSAGAVAVLGGDPPTGGVMMPILDAAHIPDLGNFASSAIEFNSPYSFPIDPGGYFGFEVTAGYVAHKLHQKVSFVAIDIPVGRTNGAIVQADTKSAVTYTGTTYVPPTTADYAPIVASASQGGPQAALLFMGGAQDQAFVQAAEQANAPFKEYLWNGVNPANMNALPASARTKVLSGDAYRPFQDAVNAKNPVALRALADMKAEYKAGDSAAQPSLWASSNWNYYLSGLALEQVTKGMKTITATGIDTALNKAKNLKFGGIISPWTPGKAGPAGFTRLANLAAFVVRHDSNGLPHVVGKKAVTPAQAIAGKF